MKEGSTSEAVLDSPQYNVKILPVARDTQTHTDSRYRQIRVVQAADSLNRLEACAAGIGAQHGSLTEPLSGSISGTGLDSTIC